MKKSLLPNPFFVLSIFLPALAFAQNNFRCTVYLPTGDSVIGFCTNFEEWRYNPDYIAFTTANGEKTSYDPDNCRGFAIARYDSYLAFEVERTINQVSILNYDRTTSPGHKTVRQKSFFAGCRNHR